ncbi:MAG: MerR family transcriptional regulator [Streptosporangiaceae bacterium]
MRITEAAQRLDTSPRMLRYRDSLGLLPVIRERPKRRAGEAGGGGARSVGGGHRHRQFGQAELDAVSAALRLEQRYDISPAALAFGLRVLADPSARAAVTDLGRRLGRLPSPPERALDFEKERALRLLGGSPGPSRSPSPGSGRRA